jgi:hypothetical protein
VLPTTWLAAGPVVLAQRQHEDHHRLPRTPPCWPQHFVPQACNIKHMIHNRSSKAARHYPINSDTTSGSRPWSTTQQAADSNHADLSAPTKQHGHEDCAYLFIAFLRASSALRSLPECHSSLARSRAAPGTPEA